MIGRLPVHLLRRHVADGAENYPDVGRKRHRRCVQSLVDGHRGKARLRQTEIENLHLTVARDEKILRLQISVDDACVVRGNETARDLNRILDRLPRREGSPAQSTAKRLAPQQLGHDVRPAIVSADVVDGENVWMIERRSGTRFPFEAALAIAIEAECGWQDFDGDLSAQARIARAIDLAHAAGPDEADDFVRTQASACCKNHGWLARLRG
jgi:hypothetical protein